MKPIGFFLIAVLLLCIPCENIKAQSPYKASVGGVVYAGIAAGPSFKAFFTDKVAFQVDFLFRGTATGNLDLKENTCGPVLYFALETDLNIVYQKKLKETSNWFWFIGGGVGMGRQLIAGNGKFGANVILGFEYVCEKIPLTIQLDLRPGYAMLYNLDSDELNKVQYFDPVKSPWSHFDWLAGLTLRYAFKEKNNKKWDLLKSQKE